MYPVNTLSGAGGANSRWSQAEALIAPTPCPLTQHSFVFIHLGCAGSSWLVWAFSSCSKWGLLTGVALKHGLSSCGTQA